MQTRPLGASGLVTTRLGLGLAALGRPGYIDLGHGRDLGPDRSVEALERRCHEVLDAAWAEGVRYLDAARSYGRAEDFLGRWLRSRDASTELAVVGSKWGYTYTAGWQVDADVHEVKDHGVDTLRRQWPESRARLGDWLRLYQVHSATLDSGVLDDRQVWAELAALRGQGVAIGLTLSGPAQADALRRALEIEVDGVRLFQVVQATWNLLERSVGPALNEAHEAGVGVIVKEALANGRLTSRGSVSPLFVEAARVGATPDALALAAVLEQPFADVVLMGVTTIKQLHSNLCALRTPLDDEARAALERVVEAPELYWRTRSALRWE